MAIYVINALSIPLYGIFVKNRKRLIFLISTQMFLILALRAETLGTDLVNYVRYYNDYQDLSLARLLQGFRFIVGQEYIWGHESGYVLVCWIFGRLGFSFHSFLVLHAAFCMTAFSIFVYRHAEDIPLAYLSFLAFGAYSYCFSELQHAMGAAVFFLSVSALKDRRLGKYLLYTVIAVLFHASLLVMLPLWFFTKIRLTRRCAVATIAVSLLLLITMPIFVEFIVAPLVTLLRGDMYSPKFGWNNLFWLIMAMLLATVFLYGSEQIEWSEENGVFYAIFAAALLLQTVSFYFSLFSRIVLGIFLPAGTNFLGDALQNYRKRDVRGAWIIKTAIYLFMLVFYFWTLKLSTDLFPYVSVFD